jgi:ribosomal protein S18 acetylase RimI-like enzyme
MAVRDDLAAAARVSRLERLDLKDRSVANAVLELQRDAYAVEAALIGSGGIPALTETLEAVRAADEEWLGAFDGPRLSGAVSWRTLDDGTIDIHRLVVAPRAFRRGIATALLDELDRTFPDRPMVVSTGSANEPALALYRVRGFRAVREREAAPGLFVMELQRARPDPPAGASRVG